MIMATSQIELQGTSCNIMAETIIMDLLGNNDIMKHNTTYINTARCILHSILRRTIDVIDPEWDTGIFETILFTFIFCILKFNSFK